MSRGRRSEASGAVASLASAAAALLLLASCAGTPTPVRDTGPITLQGACSQSDVDGFREQARLAVDRGAVRSLDWQIWIGREGTCSFNLGDFQQTRTRPHIELLARDSSGCKLLVYQDPRRVTLAHAGCEGRCTNGVSEKAWPVMFDPRSGGCANLSR
jgi:hypothetical protein